MADNVSIDPGSTTPIATDEISGAHYQRVKLTLGANNTNDGDVASGNPMPVTGTVAVTGVATAAKQPALGTAGTPSADVITVQGHGSMTALKVDGSAVTQPVSGTVTANIGTVATLATAAKQDAAQTALDAIKTATETIDNAIAGSEMQVDVVTLPNVTIGAAIPAGTNNIGDVDVASIAAGDNNIGNVDIVTVPSDPFGANADAAVAAGATGSIQAKLRRLTSDTDAIKTAVETLDNAVAGSELQVDVVGALPAGTNAIGKLAANSGVDIGDVDVTSVSGNVTVVQATASNLNATVVGTGTFAVQDSAAGTSLAVIDDWDESDRAKVNTIAGQAGVAAGAGAVAADVQRMTLASDDPAVATLGAISGAKVITDANGTLQQYLRGLIHLTIQPLKQVSGSAQTVINTATDIAAGNFSGAPAATFTNNDAAVPNAPYANAMAEFPDWAAAPVAGTVVELWGLLKDVDSTDDDTGAPATTASGGARHFGDFVIEAADALQRRTIVIDLAGINNGIGVDFYIRNGTAQNMNNDGGTSAVVKITPWSYGVV